MSTRIGSFVDEHFRPGLVTALIKVAMIGAWKGRTFLDDDNDLADVADFVPTELAPPVPLSAPAAAEAATVEAPAHSVAA